MREAITSLFLSLFIFTSALASAVPRADFYSQSQATKEFTVREYLNESKEWQDKILADALWRAAEELKGQLRASKDSRGNAKDAERLKRDRERAYLLNTAFNTQKFADLIIQAGEKHPDYEVKRVCLSYFVSEVKELETLKAKVESVSAASSTTVGDFYRQDEATRKKMLEEVYENVRATLLTSYRSVGRKWEKERTALLDNVMTTQPGQAKIFESWDGVSDDTLGTVVFVYVLRELKTRELQKDKAAPAKPARQ